MRRFSHLLLISVLMLWSPIPSTAYLEEEEELRWDEAFRWIYTELLKAYDIPVNVHELTTRLSDARPDVREAAAFLLGFEEDPDLPLELRPLLNDPDPEVRLAAVESLVRLKDPAGFFGALDLLEGQQQVMRRRVLELLAMYGESKDFRPKVIERTKEALEDEEPAVRSTAARKLVKLLDIAALPILESALQTEEDLKVRETLEFHLDRLRTKQRVALPNDED